MTQPTTQQMIQQLRAAHAWQKIESLKADDKLRKEFSSLVRSLPAMILTDGLGQSLAFLQAKAGGKTDSAHSAVYTIVSEWVCSQYPDSNNDLLQRTFKHDSSRYRQYATETLAYLQWLKRFVEAKGWKE
jgi:CRISPR-associated protein Cmr5